MAMMKKCDAAQMALEILLRLSQSWARKGKVFKRRLLLDIHLVSDYLRKSLKHTSKATSAHYGEEQFSFDSTPMIHVKMYRPHASPKFKLPHFPCLQPEVHFQDYKFESESESTDSERGGARISFLKGVDDDVDHIHGWGACDKNEVVYPFEENIDARAEEFISRFYNQMKLQRQNLVLSN